MLIAKLNKIATWLVM